MRLWIGRIWKFCQFAYRAHPLVIDRYHVFNAKQFSSREWSFSIDFFSPNKCHTNEQLSQSVGDFCNDIVFHSDGPLLLDCVILWTPNCLWSWCMNYTSSSLYGSEGLNFLSIHGRFISLLCSPLAWCPLKSRVYDVDMFRQRLNALRRELPWRLLRCPLGVLWATCCSIVTLSAFIDHQLAESHRVSTN